MSLPLPSGIHAFSGQMLDTRENLIACRVNSVEKIATEIGADSLAYLSVESAHRLSGDNGCAFCDGFFTSHYPIMIPENQGKNRFEEPIPVTEE